MSIQERDIQVAMNLGESLPYSRQELMGGMLSGVLARMKKDEGFVDEGLAEVMQTHDLHNGLSDENVKYLPLRATILYLADLCASPLINAPRNGSNIEALTSAGEGIISICGGVMWAYNARNDARKYALEMVREYNAQLPPDRQEERSGARRVLYEQILNRNVDLLKRDPSGFLVAQRTFSDNFPLAGVFRTDIERVSANDNEDARKGADFAVEAYRVIYPRAERMFQASSL